MVRPGARRAAVCAGDAGRGRRRRGGHARSAHPARALAAGNVRDSSFPRHLLYKFLEQPPFAVSSTYGDQQECQPRCHRSPQVFTSNQLCIATNTLHVTLAPTQVHTPGQRAPRAGMQRSCRYCWIGTHKGGGCIGWQDIVLALGGACMKGRADSGRRCVPSAGMRHSGRLHWRRGKPSWRPHRAAAALPAPAATPGSCCSCGWPRLCTRWEHVCQLHSLASARSVPTLLLCVESSHSLDRWQASCHKAPFTHWSAAASGSSEKTNVLRVNTRSRRRETWPPALRGRAPWRTSSAPARRPRWSACGTRDSGVRAKP